MIENELEHHESSCVTDDFTAIETSVRPRMRIKQEIILNDSQKPPLLNSMIEDSCSRSLNIKVKEEPSSKLTELKKCLEINKSISLLLVDEINRVKLAYKENLEKQQVLQKILDEDKKKKASDKPPNHLRAISVFAAPYFRDVRRMVPPNNEDTKIKMRNHDINAYLRPPRPWTKEENKKLLDGVTGFALFSALKPYKIKRDYLKRKLKDQDISEFEMEVIEDQIVSVQKKIKSISEKPLHELLEEVNGKIDWMNISAVNMEGEKTPDECENMWNNFLNFTINKEVFSFEEDERLKNLAEDHYERDWDTIAKLLKTNRTPIQCFERFQTRLSTKLKRRFWTPEEDKQLNELVEQHRFGKIIPWNKISLLMEGRTRQQIINRYERSITQKYNRGPWTSEEDAVVIACYQKFGCRWSKMKDFLIKRSTCAVRERYVNSLDPCLKVGFWSKDEDKLLITLIRRYGYGKWAKICKHIPGRTDNMCLIRASRLLEHSVKYHSEKGTGEYDPGVDDPELFARILRPIPPSNVGFARTLKIKSARENALEKLVIAINNVVPEVKVNKGNFNSLDFSWLSCELLHRISNELHRMLEERRKDEEPFVPRPRYFTKPPLIRKRLFEDSDEEMTQPSPEKLLPSNERIWLHSVLTLLFKMKKNIINPPKKTLGNVYNSRETAEISLYKAYLYKQFHCKAKCDEDDDIENVIFSGIDFSETLQTVVSYFVQPPVYEGQFIVLAPNITSIGAMEVIEVTEDRLQCMSKYVSHSKNYLDYICERRKSCPKCLQCLYRQQQITSSSTSVEKVTLDMGKDLFLVDNRMKEAIDVESAVLHTSIETCSCSQLEESRKSVQLLRQRFMALFLWPALLSVTGFNKEQDDILTVQTSNNSLNYFWSAAYNRQPSKKRRKITIKTKWGWKKKVSDENSSKKKRGRPKKVSDENSSMSLIALEGNQREPKPSTSKNLETGDLQLNSIAAEKPPLKRRKIKKESEVKEVELRRSKRLCVLKRTSFSYPEVSCKPAVSTDVMKECKTAITVVDDELKDMMNSVSNDLPVDISCSYTSKPAVSTGAMEECETENVIVVDELKDVLNSVSNDLHIDNSCSYTSKPSVSTDGMEQYETANMTVVDNELQDVISAFNDPHIDSSYPQEVV